MLKTLRPFWSLKKSISNKWEFRWDTNSKLLRELKIWELRKDRARIRNLEKEPTNSKRRPKGRLSQHNRIQIVEQPSHRWKKATMTKDSHTTSSSRLWTPGEVLAQRLRTARNNYRRLAVPARKSVLTIRKTKLTKSKTANNKTAPDWEWPIQDDQRIKSPPPSYRAGSATSCFTWVRRRSLCKKMPSHFALIFAIKSTNWPTVNNACCKDVKNDFWKQLEPTFTENGFAVTNMLNVIHRLKSWLIWWPKVFPNQLLKWMKV